MNSRQFAGVHLVVVLVLAFVMLAGGNGYAAVVDVTSFGANGSDTGDDTSAIQDAVAALNPGDELLFPEASNYYSIATNANLAIDDAGVKVMIRGKVQSSGSPADGHYVFNVTADDCDFLGEGGGGVLQGSGTYVSDSDSMIGASLIRFSNVKNCSVKNLKLVKGPHFFISFYNSNNCKVTDCIIDGGSTGVEGVFFAGTFDLLVKGNRFIKTSGQPFCWVSSDSDNNNRNVVISANKFEGSSGYAIDCVSLNNSIVSNNTIHETGDVAIRVVGPANIIANNNIYNITWGGIEARNASRCIISNNLIDQFDHIGIQVSPYDGFGGDMTDNIIHGNFIRGRDSSPKVYDGINVWSLGSISRCKISGNTILQTGTNTYGVFSGIKVYSVNRPSSGLAIIKNTVGSTSTNGIYVKNVNSSIISDNRIDLVLASAIVEEDVTVANLITDNKAN